MSDREELGLSTIVRVNPTCGFEKGSVVTRHDYGEVTLVPAHALVDNKKAQHHHHAQHGEQKDAPTKKSYAFDRILDDLKEVNKKDKHAKEDNEFASQEATWQAFSQEIDRRMQDGSSDIGVVAVGVPGSGKTHTLFGSSGKKERGLLPRFVEKSFKTGWRGAKKGSTIKCSTVLVSMYLMVGEHLVDLFRVNNPLALHTAEDNFTHSDALGPLALAARPVCASSAGECTGFVSLGLRAAAAVLASHCEVHCSASLHVRFLMISESKDLYKMHFVEAPSLTFPKMVPVNVDRLAGASQHFTAARELYVGVKEAADNSVDVLSYTRDMLRETASKSMLNYVLQDVLWRHPDCVLLTCLRAEPVHFADNAKVCDLVDVLWANQLKPSDINGSGDDESGGGGRAESKQNTEGEPAASKYGPKAVQPLKEIITALDMEIKACKTRRADIDETVRELAAAAAKAAAEKHARDTGGEPMPPPPQPTTTTGKPGGESGESTVVQTRRERNIPPPFEYTPPPAAEGGDTKQIAVLKQEKVLLARKQSYLVDILESMRVLLSDTPVKRIPLPGAKIPKGGHEPEPEYLAAGPGGCKFKLNHTPCFLPTFPDARPERSRLIHRDLIGDPYDSDEEGRAQKVRQLLNRDGLQYFAQVMQEWLNERGIVTPRVPYDSSLDGEKKEVPKGGLDMSMFESRKARSMDMGEDDDDDDDVEKGVTNSTSSSKKSQKKGAGSVVGELIQSQLDPWAKNEDKPYPYLVPLGPLSGLHEHYGKILIAPGKAVVVRGITGMTIGLAKALRQQYAATPIDNDGLKDQATFVEALGDIMGEGHLPVEDFYQGLEKEQEKEEAKRREQEAKNKKKGDSSVATEEEEDEDEKAERLEIEREEEEKQRKAELDRAVASVIVSGPGISPLHCYFKSENQKSLTVRPNTIISSAAASLAVGSKNKSKVPLVAVNGKIIIDTVPLADLDVVRVGMRYFLVRVPMKIKKTNDPMAVEESLFSLTKWELCLLRSHMDAVRCAIEESLLSRLHISHQQADRSLLSVLKQEDKTRLNSVPTYDIPKEAVDHIYKGISPLDRVFLAESHGMCLALNSYSQLMRRGFSAQLQLGELSGKDQKYRRLVHVHTPPVDIFTKPVDELAMQSEVKHGNVVNDTSESAAKLIGTVTNTGGRMPVKYRVREKDKDGAAPQNQLLSAHLVCSMSEAAGGGGSFVWNTDVAAERLHLLLLMHRSFNAWWCSRDPSWLNILYPPALDPANDAQEDELIGVGYLYLDSFQHLIDVNDIVPLVAVDGSQVGHLKVRGRVWIDKMETNPAYLTVDSEKHIKDFENKMCLLRLYFESLIDLPASQCASTYVRFNFFYHSKPYTTLRHGGHSTHPFLHSAVKVEQRITGDFLEYVNRGSLELEVYGKRKKVSGPAVQALQVIAEYHVGELVVEEGHDASEESEGENAAEDGGEDKAAMSEADMMVQSLASKLEKTEDLLSKSKDVTSQVIAEKKDMERKIAALKAQLEAAETGSNKKGNRRGEQEEQSSVCVMS